MAVLVEIGTWEPLPARVFLEALIARINAVALVRAAGRGDGTGFLIDESVLITNNHVLTGGTKTRAATPREAGAAKAIFGYESPGDDLKVKNAHSLRPDGLFFASAELDFALCRVSGRPGKRWGAVPLAVEGEVAIGDDVYVVQHPDGRPKEIAAAGNIVTCRKLRSSTPQIHFTVPQAPPFSTAAGNSSLSTATRRAITIPKRERRTTEISAPESGQLSDCSWTRHPRS